MVFEMSKNKQMVLLWLSAQLLFSVAFHLIFHNRLFVLLLISECSQRDASRLGQQFFSKGKLHTRSDGKNA